MIANQKDRSDLQVSTFNRNLNRKIDNAFNRQDLSIKQECFKFGTRATLNYSEDGSKRLKVLVATGYTIWRFNGQFYAEYIFSSIIERYDKELGVLSLSCPVKDVSDVPTDFIDITNIVKELVPITRLDALLRRKNKKLEKIISDCDLVLGRMPGFIPLWIENVAHKVGTPCFSEVMGCGWDAFWNHGLLGKLAAPYMFLSVRNALRQSQFALYVTEKFLQRRYPCPNPTVGVSNVVIEDISDAILENRKKRISTMNRKEVVLMTSAAVYVWYKGQHFVIRAIPLLNKMGIRVKYYCVGQGDPSYLRRTAKKYGVEDQVFFTGAVSHEKVFELLDECDIYIQPSLQEGLPRALVEAMSRGCPAIGSKTGGIPELVSDNCVLPRKAVSEIAQKIKLMLDDGLERYAEENFKRAKDFQKSKLDKRRNAYFQYVKQTIRKK